MSERVNQEKKSPTPGTKPGGSHPGGTSGEPGASGASGASGGGRGSGK